MTYVKKITAALAAAMFAAGCTSAPPPPPEPVNEKTQAVQRLKRELPKSKAQTAAKPAKAKKKVKWERHSVEKRKRLTDTSKPVLIDGGGDDDGIFFWRDGSERRSEKLNRQQREKFRD